jgi:hypothetical protein
VRALSKGRPPNVTTFDRLNYLADEVQRDVNTVDLKVLLIFLRHADADGVAFPGPETVARKVGFHLRSAKRVIARLTERDHLRIYEAGGGRGQVTKRLVLPRTPSRETVTGMESPFTPETVTGEPTKQCPAQAESVTETAINSDRKTVTRTTRTTEKELTTTPPSAADVVSSTSKEIVRRALLRMGFSPPAADRLLRGDAAHVLHVARVCVLCRMTDGVQHPPKWVTSRVNGTTDFRSLPSGDLIEQLTNWLNGRPAPMLPLARAPENGDADAQARKVHQLDQLAMLARSERTHTGVNGKPQARNHQS